MNKNYILKKTAAYVKNKLRNEFSGHDWYHAQRVFKMATFIAGQEKNADLFTIQLAALLHDIGDWKVNSSKKSEAEILRLALKEIRVPKEVGEKILQIILNMSFSKNLDKKHKLSIEGQIVQDADRLDALGAIGIARAFAYGGKNSRQLYNPKIKPKLHNSTSSYRKAKSTTINHFYEKLFLLKSQMNTKTAQVIAAKREKFMKKFLKEFYAQWKEG